MLKVTLDTNVIINLQKAEILTRVGQLTEDGKIDIVVTTRVVADTDQDADEARRSKHLVEFANYPVIGTLARWDFSRWDSGDVWGGGSTEQLAIQIEQVLFGKIHTTDKHAHNKRADVDHLVGHRLAARDVFVTYDGHILKRRSQLLKKLAIVVESPVELIGRFV